MFKLTDISATLFITSAVNFGVTFISWRRQDAKVGRYFAWGMLTVALWTFASGLDYSATTIPLKVLFAKLEYIFYHGSLTLFLMFALAYSGHHDWLENRLVQFVMWIPPIGNSILVSTNELHGWVWSGFTWNVDVDNVLIFQHGPGFVWVALTDYIAILLIFFFLWRAMHSSSELTRRQSQLLLGATFVPIATNLLYLFEIIPMTQGVDWTAVTFSISGLLFLMALYGMQLLNIVPIAHHLIIESMPDCVLVLDPKNRVVDFNPAMQEKFGLGRKHLGEIVQSAMARWPAVIVLAFSDTDPTPIEIILDDPQLSVFDVRLTRLVDVREHVYGKLIVFRNVTQRYQARQELQEQLIEVRELHEKVRYLAERDSLTNAFTRRYLYDRLSEMTGRKNPNAQFVAVLMDIDKFKRINDKYGHAAGDTTLIALVDILFAHAQPGDIICRFGGEEFVVIMPDTTMKDAVSRFERVGSEFQEFRLPEFDGGITVSVGLAEYPTHSREIDELLNIADKAMYQAKRAGGNQTAVFSTLM